MTVQAILDRIARGETQAFAELVTLYQHALFGFLGRLGMTQAQAEDIAQETFLRAWTHLPTYEPQRAQFVTWLFTIARHLAYNAMQKEPRAVNACDADLPEPMCERAGPDGVLDRAQQHARLQAALRQLPMQDRSALALVYVHELALADVARIENDSLAAIKTRLHRAKHKLRALLHLDSASETSHET